MEILFFLFLALLAWFWWDSVGAKEVARQQGRVKCMTYQLQFLDDTVAVSKIRLRRDGSGQIRVYRLFDFEFSADGLSRHKGRVEMLGRRVLNVQMDAYPIDHQSTP